MMPTLRCGCSMADADAGAVRRSLPHAAVSAASHKATLQWKTRERAISESVFRGSGDGRVAARAHVGADRAGAQLVQVVDDVLVAHQLRAVVLLVVNELLQLTPVAAGERLLRESHRNDRVQRE